MQINYTNRIRFRTANGNQYLSCPGPNQAFGLKNSPDDSCVFTLFEYNWEETTYGFCYSGNLDADTIDCRMNFRLSRPNMGEQAIVSVDVDQNRGIGPNALFNGVNRDEADDFETFLCFDPDNIGNTGPIMHGSKVIIRNMRGAASNNLQKFWRDWGQRLVASASGRNAAAQLQVIEQTIRDTNAERLFITVADLGQGWKVGAFGPTYDFATAFIIELVG